MNNIKEKMKAVRNVRELELVKQNLKFQQMLYEKEVAGATSKIGDSLNLKLRDFAFDLGSRLVSELISMRRRRRIQGE